MDFVFISMCITKSYYACLVLLICNDRYSTHYSTLGGWQDAKRLSFSREPVELNWIHSFCPRRLVSVSSPPHGLFHWGWDALLFASFKKKKCNKCFQWITNFNIDPQPTCIFVTSLFRGFPMPLSAPCRSHDPELVIFHRVVLVLLLLTAQAFR